MPANSEAAIKGESVYRDHRNVRGKPPKSDLRGSISKEGKTMPSMASPEQYKLYSGQAIVEIGPADYFASSSTNWLYPSLVSE